MRRLMWFTLGTIIGIAAGVWVLSGSMLWIIAIFFGIIGLAVSFLPLKGSRLTGLIAFGCAVGLICMFITEQKRVVPESALDGTERYLQITVLDYAVIGEFDTTVEGSFILNGRNTPVSVYISEKIELEPGDQISGFFGIHFSSYKDGSGNDFYQGDMIMLLASAKGPVQVYHPAGFYPDLSIAGIREKIRQQLIALFPDDTSGFALALLLGDSSGLRAENDNALQNSGIRHIIAVSGLHVSMLFGLVDVLVGRRKRLFAMIGIPVLFLFAGITGFTPSVLRACFMQLMLLLSYLSKREHDGLTSISASALIILLMNPLALISISFQLSFGCVLGITLFGGNLYRYILSFDWAHKLLPRKFWGGLVKGVALSVAISLSTMLFTLPISVYYFGIISTVSVLTNLLTIWLITYIFCGLLICCLLSIIYLPLGVILAQILSILIRFVLLIARSLADLPYASIDSHNVYVLSWLVLAYAMLIANLLLKKKKPLITAICVIGILCVALLLCAIEGRTGDFRVTVLDVGQGQCIILQSGQECYVVDCGGDSGAAAADLAAHTLKNQGISHVNGVILSHYDKDHSGGVLDFMSQMSVDTLYLPDVDKDNALRLELESELAHKIQWVSNTRYFQLGEGMITVYTAADDKTGNESSMCILFQWGKCDILIAGDMNMRAEAALMQDVRLPKVDILIVGHHGSGDATSMEFLNAIRPGTAVISVGDGNRFGHPAADVLTRLHIYKCRIFRTDLHGTIVFKG